MSKLNIKENSEEYKKFIIQLSLFADSILGETFVTDIHNNLIVICTLSDPNNYSQNKKYYTSLENFINNYTKK